MVFVVAGEEEVMSGEDGAPGRTASVVGKRGTDVMVGRRAISLVVATAGAVAVAYAVVAAVPGLRFFAEVLVAAVFLFAGVAKLIDRESFAGTLGGLGIGEAPAWILAAVLPLAELAVAAALLVPRAATAGGLGAFALLLLFSAVAGVAVAQGRKTDCGCFGKDHAAPLSGLTLLRNGVLAGFSGAIVLTGTGVQDASFEQGPNRTSLIALCITGCIAIGLLAAQRANRQTGGAVETSPDLTAIEAGQPAATAFEARQPAALTRRRLIRAAGGAALAGTMGWLDASPAAATLRPGTVKDSIECSGGCTCCRLALTTTGPVCLTYCCSGCTGFSGGGVVSTSTGSAHASFSGTKLKVRNKQQLILGTLTWFDSAWHGTGLLLQSTSITKYGRVPGTDIRELTGFATVNGAGKHGFVLHVVDGGKPGAGSDTVSLHVTGVAAGGAGAGGSEYAANGHLSQGDITANVQAAVASV